MFVAAIHFNWCTEQRGAESLGSVSASQTGGWRAAHRARWWRCSRLFVAERRGHPYHCPGAARVNSRRFVVAGDFAQHIQLNIGGPINPLTADTSAALAPGPPLIQSPEVPSWLWINICTSEAALQVQRVDKLILLVGGGKPPFSV